MTTGRSLNSMHLSSVWVRSFQLNSVARRHSLEMRPLSSWTCSCFWILCPLWFEFHRRNPPVDGKPWEHRAFSDLGDSEHSFGYSRSIIGAYLDACVLQQKGESNPFSPLLFCFLIAVLEPMWLGGLIPFSLSTLSLPKNRLLLSYCLICDADSVK